MLAHTMNTESGEWGSIFKKEQGSGSRKERCREKVFGS